MLETLAPQFLHADIVEGIVNNGGDSSVAVGYDRIGCRKYDDIVALVVDSSVTFALRLILLDMLACLED